MLITASLPRDEAIPLLLDEHGAMILSLSRKLCGNGDEAEDVLQETFLQAYKGWSGFEGRSSPRTWLYTIAARTCQRLHRKRANEPQHIESFEELAPFGNESMGVPDDKSETPLSIQIREESIDAVEKAITTLPIDFRTPLVLADILDFSMKDIAEIMQIKVATVKTRIHRARFKLRRALESTLEKKAVPATEYSMQICQDLLSLKMDSLDRGESSTPKLDEVMCQRCSVVFDTLSMTKEVCKEITSENLSRSQKKHIIDLYQDADK
ncbi:MAG: RNA polymerase sigma-70 factor (ECF subfamily) [Myxococcota bacterium]|jgi:RNA polymerase sigma-70 factor (ECF subfamily)